MMQKVLCFLSAVAFFLMVSFEPVRASAVGTDDVIFTIAQWYDEVEQRIVETEQAVLTDLQNGNLDATTELGKERLREWSLQLLSVQNPVMYSIVHAADLAIQGIPDGYEFFENNPTIVISGSGVCGFYRTTEDGDIKPCTLYSIDGANQSNSYLMASSPDFNVICTLNKTATITPYYQEYPNVYDPYVRIGGQYSGPRDGMKQSWHDEKGYLADYSINYGDFVSSPFAISCYLQKIPVIPRGQAPNGTLCGLGSSVELPEATIETTAPWDYYNTQILPRIPDLPDNYVIFPDGYIPTVPQDPTEPTYPPGDLILPPYGELMTEPSSYFVTDESGETITDESGQPLTETTMVPVTVASSEDGVWRFKIPTLPDLSSPSEVPTFSASLPQRLVGLSSALFQAVYNILDSSGVLGILPFLIGVAVICYMIYKIGG